MATTITKETVGPYGGTERQQLAYMLTERDALKRYTSTKRKSFIFLLNYEVGKRFAVVRGNYLKRGT